VFRAAVRLVVTAMGGVAGWQITVYLRHARTLLPSLGRAWEITVIVLIVLAGLAIGLLLGSLLSRWLRRGLVRLDLTLARITGSEIVVGTAGLLIGLGAAAILSLAITRIPVLGPYLLLPFFIISGYIGAYLAAKKNVEILRLIGVRPPFEETHGEMPAKILDSSAIIDGRITDIIKAGFVEGELLVPRFVVEELQRLADSGDAEKRVRGRRGLDFVRKLQAVSDAVRVLDRDFADLAEVDAKLVRLGHELHAGVVTTDYTLNKVAEIQGVRVLNVNDLANAVKSAVLPGEHIEVKILREGREHDQGVGYLDDGTMIVVEAARALVGSRVTAEVTSVLQSPSGKMVFTRLVR
jgi:uncharacterized protein YacL